MVDCDCRLFPFCVLLLIGVYAATSRNYFRFVFINFRADIDRKRPVVSSYDTDSRSERPQCSFPVFQKYLRRTRSNYLPGGGRWTRRGGMLERFQPDLCWLSHGRWVPRDRVARCFARLNVSYIVILGDSNALRLYRTSRRALSAADGRRSFICDHIDRHYDDVSRLPARRCTPNYYGIRYANYFRCTFAVDGLPVASLLVQYLPIVFDMMPIQASLNGTVTGCVDGKTSNFFPTQASTVQVSTSPCRPYCLGQSSQPFMILLTVCRGRI